MKRTILSTLLAVFCSSIWAVTAQDISALHHAGETLQCSFTEVKTMPRAKKEISKSGNLTYTHPSDLRLDYTDPAGDYTLISKDVFEVRRNGKVQHFNISNPEQRMSVFRQSLLYAFAGDTEALTTLNEAQANYQEKGNTYICTVTANKTNGTRGIAKLQLTYNKKSGVLQSLIITENNGNYTTYTVKK